MYVRIMLEKRIIVAFVFVLMVFGFSIQSIAECKSDCLEEYESEVESCKEQYDDPGEADMFQTCIEDAKNQYQSCIDECEY